MKTNTKVKKVTKKAFKPVFVVDATNCEDTFDLLVQFGIAKQKAGLPITDDELNAIVDDNSALVIIREIVETECECKKKLPWYKRFWNKLKYAFPW